MVILNSLTASRVHISTCIQCISAFAIYVYCYKIYICLIALAICKSGCPVALTMSESSCLVAWTDACQGELGHCDVRVFADWF